MVDLSRVRVNWTGFVGGPGVSTFYFLDTSACMPHLHDMLYSMAHNLPPDVHLQIVESGDKIDEVTGLPSGAWAEDPTDPIIGAGGDNYAAPVGFLVNWLTDDVGPHRRIKGKTFFVPGSSDCFTDNGDIQADVHNSLLGAAQLFVTHETDNFMVWHRPHGGEGGLGHAVTAATMPYKPTILTSRRD
jgi:hypothetical protein